MQLTPLSVIGDDIANNLRSGHLRLNLAPKGLFRLLELVLLPVQQLERHLQNVRNLVTEVRVVQARRAVQGGPNLQQIQRIVAHL